MNAAVIGLMLNLIAYHRYVLKSHNPVSIVFLEK
jgi:hypothetical protein